MHFIKLVWRISNVKLCVPICYYESDIHPIHSIRKYNDRKLFVHSQDTIANTSYITRIHCRIMIVQCQHQQKVTTQQNICAHSTMFNRKWSGKKRKINGHS